MRIVVQRVAGAKVVVEGNSRAEIGTGLLLLVGVADSDTTADVDVAVGKIASMRIFPDSDDRMNRSLLDVVGAALVVSQFTLYGDIRKGRRPSFTDAGDPDHARELVARLADGLRQAGVDTEEGVFGARMDVEITNRGPVTIVFDVTGGRVS